jgi:hypothetical protein
MASSDLLEGFSINMLKLARKADITTVIGL